MSIEAKVVVVMVVEDWVVNLQSSRHDSTFGLFEYWIPNRTPHTTETINVTAINEAAQINKTFLFIFFKGLAGSLLSIGGSLALIKF